MQIAEVWPWHLGFKLHSYTWFPPICRLSSSLPILTQYLIGEANSCAEFKHSLSLLDRHFEVNNGHFFCSTVQFLELKLEPLFLRQWIFSGFIDSIYKVLIALLRWQWMTNRIAQLNNLWMVYTSYTGKHLKEKEFSFLQLVICLVTMCLLATCMHVHV